MQELKLALRRLWRRPGRGALTAMALAIGIGTTTAAFAALDGVLLRPLPVDRQDDLVVIWHLNPARASLEIPFRPASYEAVVDGTKSLATVAGFTAWGAAPTPVGTGSDSYALNRVQIAGDFFGVLGTRAALGRLPTRADDDVAATAVAVLSHAAWRTRYGADPGVVGSTLLIGDVTHTVIGVGGEGLDFPQGTEVWTPLRLNYAQETTPYELHVVGRMAPGVVHATVAADVTAALTAVGGDEGRFWADVVPVVRSLEEVVVGPVRPVLQAGFAAALLLLVAALANSALFLLAEGQRTAHDLAVRLAYGAGRPRLVVSFLADSALFGVVGTVGGLALAWLALRLLVPSAPPELGRLESVVLGWREAGFGAVLGLVSVVTSPLAVGAVLSRFDLSRALAAGGRGVRGSSSGFQRVIAGLQISLAVVSAVGAGLLLRTVDALNQLDPGMSADDMTAVTLSIPYTWFDVPPAYFDNLDVVVRELESRPGILAARPSLGPPLQQRLEVVLSAEGQSDEDVRENPYVAVDAVLPGHLLAMGIPLLRGREFTELDDRPDADPVVVIDQPLANALWPGVDPLGKRISGFGYRDTWFTVVGVAAETRYRELLAPHPRAYYPLRRMANSPPSTLLVRSSLAASPLVGDLVREAFARVEPSVRVLDAQRMTTLLRRPTVGRRFAASTLGVFAIATLLLAGLGVYGVVTVSVQERTREIGVRRALGAQPTGIVQLVMLDTLKTATVGAAVGLILALWANALVAPLLYGVTPVDAITFVAGAAGCVLVALAAALVPARRASAIDPAVGLAAD